MEDTQYDDEVKVESVDEGTNFCNTSHTNNNIKMGLPKGFRLMSPNNVYVIERVLGYGTFGITYLAKCNGRNVAIKEFFMHQFCGRRSGSYEVTGSSPGNLIEDYGRRFLLEAYNLKKLNHDNIVRVFETFEANKTFYYSMDYIDGCNLNSYLSEKGAMKEKDATNCMKVICKAIEYLHSKKLLHLDLKPSNIMRSTNGNYYVIDFGLSKQFNEKGEPETSSNIGLGTQGYAPTEQIEHNGKVFAPWIDVYALGGIFFKLLTGNTPPSANEILTMGLPVDALKKKGTSKATIKLIKAMMEPIWKKRIPSVSSVIEKLATPSKLPKSDEEKGIKVSKGEFFSLVFCLAISILLLTLILDDTIETVLFDNIWENGNWGMLFMGGLFFTIPYYMIKWKCQKYFKKTLISIFVLFSFFCGLALNNMDWSRINPIWSSYKNRVSGVGEVTYKVGDVKFTMIPVSSGTFVMGMDSLGATPHEVTITKDYYIGETEVTQGLWKAVMGTYREQYSYNDKFIHPNQPVAKVSYEEVLTFIKRLNSILNMNFRLPTEAEWEFAARGGNKSEGYKYSGSNNLDDVAWYGENNPHNYVSKVAKKKPNELGLYDMSGNVSEWCSDWYEWFNTSSPQTDPAGPSSGTWRVIRGGCLYSDSSECQSTYRRWSDFLSLKENDDFNLGFRLAL